MFNKILVFKISWLIIGTDRIIKKVTVRDKWSRITSTLDERKNGGGVIQPDLLYTTVTKSLRQSQEIDMCIKEEG